MSNSLLISVVTLVIAGVAIMVFSKKKTENLVDVPQVPAPIDAGWADWSTRVLGSLSLEDTALVHGAFSAGWADSLNPDTFNFTMYHQAWLDKVTAGNAELGVLPIPTALLPTASLAYQAGWDYTK